MVVKLGTSCLHWTQPTLSSPSLLKRCSFSDGAVVFKHLRKLDRSSLFSNNHNKSRSSSSNPLRRSCSASADSSPFSDEEFAKELQELAMRLNTPDGPIEPESSPSHDSDSKAVRNSSLERPDWPLEAEWRPLEADWPLEPTGIEWKASSVELPVSLRIIKRKRQWREGFKEAGESAKCSVKKAFSSMVFIIRELQCFAIQTRETVVLYEDLQGILSRVQLEMHASFVWLFQQVFSRTPTLMVYVMILLANYSVYSMAAFAAPPPPITETVSITEYSNSNSNNNKFDHKSSVRAFYLSSDSGRMESVGGSGGGGGDFRPVSSGTEGGGKFGSEQTFVGGEEREKESVSGQELGEEDSRLWDSFVDRATKMRSEALGRETLLRFVSPVSAKMESDDYVDYFRTELFYQMGLAQDPINPLLLANYAQFLYLVVRDHNRAEEYFKRAVKVKPTDAEALNKYASFLWQAKKDLWGAEENYLDAISADPTNSYYAANYAHFLWSTGGEDTCFPIDAPNVNCDET